jgi:hypothetical protein
MDKKAENDCRLQPYETSEALEKAYVCRDVFRKNSLWIGILNFADLTITLPHWLKPLMTTDPTELQDTQSLRRRDEGFTQT